MATITFIGLGNMGGPMASNLVKAGHDVTVFDLSKDAVQTLVSEGAKTADTAHQAMDCYHRVLAINPDNAEARTEMRYIGG